MMDSHSHSRWRRALAEGFAVGYRGLPGVRAVLLTGSVARGLADRYSDVELAVFWDDPPSDGLRRQAAQVGGGVLVACHEHDEDNDEWADDVLVSGVEVQASHRTVAATERWLADVTTGFDPDLVKQDLIALIRYGVPLHGADLIRSWQRRTADYPPALGLAMVRAHLDFRSAWQRRKLLDRGELVPLYADLVDTARNVVLVLLGLNRVYFPHLGFKWIPRLVDELTDAPAELAARLDAVFTAQPHEAVRTADALIEETLRLVRSRLPQAGAAEELALFRAGRPVWDGPPAAADTPHPRLIGLSEPTSTPTG
jgi:hypothetical protein